MFRFYRANFFVFKSIPLCNITSDPISARVSVAEELVVYVRCVLTNTRATNYLVLTKTKNAQTT